MYPLRTEAFAAGFWWDRIQYGSTEDVGTMTNAVLSPSQQRVVIVGTIACFRYPLVLKSVQVAIFTGCLRRFVPKSSLATIASSIPLCQNRRQAE